MVKIQPKPVNGSALFQEAVGALVTPVSHQELAEHLDCSVPLLRAALRDPKVSSFRNPPAGWEVTVRRMLEAKAAHFAEVAKRLTPNR